MLIRVKTALRLGLAIASFAAQSALAQGAPLDLRYSMFNEGNMFKVKIIPAAGKLEVYVIGREVANAELGDVGITGELRLGKKTYMVDPTRKNDHFEINTPKSENPADVYNLRLKVQSRDKSEDFDFKAIPSRP